MRPTVCNGYEREFLYVYGAVSPMQGQLDWMIAGEMNTVRMTEFLAQVSAAHRREFIIMVVDGASSHVAKDLVVPKNIGCCACRPTHPSSTLRNMSGTSCGRRSFPTACTPTWPACAHNLRPAYPGSLAIARRFEA
jgi:hypothetical protein